MITSYLEHESKSTHNTDLVLLPLFKYSLPVSLSAAVLYVTLTMPYEYVEGPISDSADKKV